MAPSYSLIPTPTLAVRLEGGCPAGCVEMAQNRMKGATAKEVFQRIDQDGAG